MNTMNGVRLSFLGILLSTAGCSETIGLPSDSELLTPLLRAQAALEASDVTEAHGILEDGIASGAATAEEYGLSAMTYLMTVTDSCPTAALGFAELGVALDVPHDIFGVNGFFGRASAQTFDDAATWLEGQLQVGQLPSPFGGDQQIQEALDAFLLLAPCLDEFASRLDTAFNLVGAGALEVRLPAGLLFTDADLIFEGSELRFVQAIAETASSIVRMADGLDWSLTYEAWNGIYLDNPTQAELDAAWLEMQARADLIVDHFLTLEPGGAAIFSAEQSIIRKALQHFQNATARARAASQDAHGAFMFSQVQEGALDRIEEAVVSALGAVDGWAVAPASDGTTWSFLPLFDATWTQPSYDPFVVEEYAGGSQGYAFVDLTLASVEGYWAELVNQFFSVPVLDDPGPFGTPAEGEVFLYTDEDRSNFDESAGLFTPLETYFNRNWDGLWDDISESAPSTRPPCPAGCAGSSAGDACGCDWDCGNVTVDCTVGATEATCNCSADGWNWGVTADTTVCTSPSISSIAELCGLVDPAQ